VKTDADEADVAKRTLRLGHYVPIDFVSFDLFPEETLTIEAEFDFWSFPVHITEH
jgi:hypothetical protein